MLFEVSHIFFFHQIACDIHAVRYHVNLILLDIAYEMSVKHGKMSYNIIKKRQRKYQLPLQQGFVELSDRSMYKPALAPPSTLRLPQILTFSILIMIVIIKRNRFEFLARKINYVKVLKL